MLRRFLKEIRESEYARERLRGTILFAAGVIVFALVAGFLFRQTPARPPAGRMDIASDFPEGEWFNVTEPLRIYGQLQGHVVVILFDDFNALNDLEGLNRLCSIETEFRDQSVMCVVVAAGRDADTAASIIDQWGIHFPLLADPDHIAMSSFGVRAIPALLVIDTASRVAARYYHGWHQIPLESIIWDLIDQGIATRSIAVERYIPPPEHHTDGVSE